MRTRGPSREGSTPDCARCQETWQFWQFWQFSPGVERTTGRLLTEERGDYYEVEVSETAAHVPPPVAPGINRHQQDIIEQLVERNRVLQGQVIDGSLPAGA